MIKLALILMKSFFGFLFFAIIILTSCNNNPLKNDNETNDSSEIEITKKNSFTLIDRDSVLRIADENARTAYRDLSVYTVKATLKDEKWYVDYELSNPDINGGGPHYIISAKTGEILSYRFEQ